MLDEAVSGEELEKERPVEGGNVNGHGEILLRFGIAPNALPRSLNLKSIMRFIVVCHELNKECKNCRYDDCIELGVSGVGEALGRLLPSKAPFISFSTSLPT
jgi:hypothetical protein